MLQHIICLKMEVENIPLHDGLKKIKESIDMSFSIQVIMKCF